MKKLILFVAVISAMSLASCKKEQSCTCTHTDPTTGDSYTTITVFDKTTKKNAKNLCQDYTQTSSSSLGSNIENVSCEVK